jgi:hypothetical protein
MLFAGLEPDNVPWTNLLHLSAFALDPSATRDDNQRLTEWMRVPGSARARLKSHNRASDARWGLTLKHGIDPHCPSEPTRRTLR